MTTLAERTIAALRSNHDHLTGLVHGLSDEQLSWTSGASEWPVAQVLSHLGSGSEIALAGLRAAQDGVEMPGHDHNRAVWARWDTLAPREQAAACLEHDAALVGAFEALPADQREELQVRLGFVPAPLPLASIAGMRLSEAALHTWDVAVALDPAATVDDTVAAVLLEQLSGGLGFLLGFTGKADALSERAVVGLERSELALVVDQQVSLTSGADATATFSGAPESVVRLLSGRLAPPHTPAGTQVTGNVTLDDLRRVFPGY
jgi:uncharacterized protein (TIGR03083 family)